MTAPDSKDRVALLERAKAFLEKRLRLYPELLPLDVATISLWLMEFSEREIEAVRHLSERMADGLEIERDNFPALWERSPHLSRPLAAYRSAKPTDNQAREGEG